ncbi:MAG: RsmE family RNA methyltransferase [Candidatus Marinimicrobia bacterium]|nr:RsmE family RNA methyltransferase [Candidatus Neomarinimicrobiota bacterium]
MAHEQFFFTQYIQNEHLMIEGQEHLHLSRVMRKKIGDHIWVSDGVGKAYYAEILSIEKENTHCKILKSYPQFGEPQNKVSLAVGLIKPAHWEIMLEKAVELGVWDIYPLITRYTVVKGLKQERGAKIILSALKQCGRSHLPILHDPVPFGDFIKQKHHEITYICDNQDDYPTLEEGMDTGNYLVLIGPEGGFHPDEVDLAIQHSAQPVLLTNRRLRTETACIAALSRLVV